MSGRAFGMEKKKKSAPPKNNGAYSLPDSIGFVDQWGHLPFWVFSVAIIWRRWVGTDFSVTIQLCNNMGALSVGMLF